KVAEFSSYYQGMGSFLLLAKANEKYTAKITKPAGISERYNLPLAKANTANLNIIEQTKDRITLRVSSNVEANYALMVTSREQVFVTELLDKLNGEKTIEINTKDLPIGIAKLTLFNGENQPIAERLAFVNPRQQLNIEIETDKENYQLRETVKAKIKVTDENGKPVKGQFSVSVVDETLLTHADDKQANLLAYYLLTSDLKGNIKEPNFYFEAQTEDDRVDRKKALDYVLLTHGWRRFSWEQMMVNSFPRMRYQFETTKFQGQVIDAFNRPLANAKVIVEGSKRWKDATYETTTDRYGRFVLNKVGLLPPFTLKASYGEFSERKDIGYYSQNCRMKLMANYSRDIHGRVVDYRSRGIEGRKIEITGKKMPTLAAVSDSLGNWMIPNVDLHKYKLVSLHYQGVNVQGLDLSYYANGNTVLFRRELNKISTLEGKAVNHRREPLEGAMVTIQGMKDTVWTDGNGKFVMPNVDFSKYRVIKAVYDGRHEDINFHGRHEPILRFKTSDYNIKINYAEETTNQPVIRGVVLDESVNETLIGTSIIVYQNGKMISGVQTDFDGKFVIKNLPKGKYNLEFKYIGFDNSFAKDVEINDRNVDMKVPMYTSAIALNDVVITGYGTSTNSYVDEYITIYDTAYAMRTVDVPAVYETFMESIIIKEPEVREIPVPAEYETIEERVEVSSGVFETRTKTVLVKPAYTALVEIPAEYSTITKQVLKEPATTREEIDKSQPPTVTSRIIKKTIKTKKYAPINFPTITANKIQNIPTTGENLAAYTQATPISIRDVNVLDEVVVSYSTPLIEQDNTTQGAVIVSKDIDRLRMGNRKVNGIIAQSAGISSAESGQAISIRGSRSNATDYYIDGVRVGGSVIPQSEIEQLRVITGGIPASFGDGDFGNFSIGNQDINFYTNQDGEKIEAQYNRVYLEIERDDYYYGKPGTYTTRRAVIDYGRAVRFQRGYYKARTFYTPKYGSLKAITRDDFRTTLYWENAMETNDKGVAKFDFPNADATTNYRITVAGFSNEGGIGLSTEKYFVQMPFALQTKVPNSVLTGDKLVIPVTLMNNTDEVITGDLMMQVPAHFELQNIIPRNIKLQPNSVRVLKLEFDVGSEISKGDVYFNFQSEDFEDAFATQIRTISRGFPVNEVMANNKISGDFEFNLSQPLEGTVDIKLTVHPNVLSDLVTGVDRMFRQPNGCFEQVSSSNYPNLLALNYIRNTNNKNQSIEAKAERFLAAGYEKMKGYEVEGGGFDWWGKAPAHEGLSAYGLMQLVDMSNVYDVDKALIDRTANWLLSRRDGEGNWERNSRALHTWVGNDLVFNNYIIWGLAEAGYGDKISAEIEANYEKTIQSENPYVMALMANTLSILNDERADDLIEALLLMQQKDGSWKGISRSITGSSGRGLDIETTALVALALMDWEADEEKSLRNAIDYLAKAKNQYGFGSTQSTVLALKALVEYAEHTKNMGEDGEIILYRGMTEIATFDYEASMTEPIVFDSLQQYFNKENNKLKVRFVGVTKALPYDLSVNYHTTLPQNDPLTHININTTIEKPKAMIGETVRLKVELNSTHYVPIENPIAVVGIPSGLSLQPWQLRALEEKNAADYIELWNGYIVFYFRELTGEKVINLDLKAEAAGTFEAPASSAYLYYDNDKKSWSLPQKVEIQ
ncbi:MAG: carboxypeptidase regulatory-like domain-containing protein, partial [Saprospiraceae bacterium]